VAPGHKARVYSWFVPAQKTLKKVKKKLVSPCPSQLNEDFDATSRPKKPFKKTLKKVKKKLVSVPKV
jgi:hypothetical protein